MRPGVARPEVVKVRGETQEGEEGELKGTHQQVPTLAKEKSEHRTSPFFRFAPLPRGVKECRNAWLRAPGCELASPERGRRRQAKAQGERMALGEGRGGHHSSPSLSNSATTKRLMGGTMEERRGQGLRMRFRRVV